MTDHLAASGAEVIRTPIKDLDAAIEFPKQALAIQRAQKAYDVLQETKDRLAILVTEKRQ